MNKASRLIKRYVALIFVLLFSIESFAAVVGDNDGAAFITKAEFDSLKNDFQSQLDRYNSSIDNKIDGAIASYLSGIKIAKSGDDAVINSGVYWSIGPFDRPRYKQGICIYDILSERVYTNNNGTLATGWKLNVSWGDGFINKVEITNPDYAYTDLLVEQQSADRAYGQFSGVYTNSGHFLQGWQLNNWQHRYPDDIATQLDDDDVLLSFPTSRLAWNNYFPGDFRFGLPATQGGSPNVQWPTNNPQNMPGVSWNYSVNPGSLCTWNDRISCFAPLTYHCFTNAGVNQTENLDGLRTRSQVKDEICYIEVDKAITQSPGHVGLISDKNLMYQHCPDLIDTDVTPWGTSYTGMTSNCHVWTTSVATGSFITNDKTVDVYMGRGWTGYSTLNNWMLAKTYYIMPDVPFSKVDNWSHLGRPLDSVTQNYLYSLNEFTPVFEMSNRTSILSLAAGLPVCEVKKSTKITITGTFRDGCYYDNANALHEGTVDDNDVYIVYAKLTPFDITKYPENETDLIDISSIIKDTANVDKLAKCRIVRDGNLKLEIENDSFDDKVLFLKWEKLSNWSAIGSTRRTGAGTNTDIRVRNTDSDTETPPTWTYFGGGYLKIDNRYTWENLK